MLNKPTIDLLWFKRDLRLRDHAPLQAAIAKGQRALKRPLLLRTAPGMANAESVISAWW